MIYTYGFSLTGTSHLQRNVECQDAHKIKTLDNGWVIAAIADGIGSAKHSGIGSKIAVESTVDFCDRYMPSDYSTMSIKSMIRTAYNYAFKSIIIEAQNQGNSIEDYDTTLDLVLFDGKKIVYGHCGDGGIIGLTVNGDYVSITSPQKGADYISVIPLRGGYNCWEIDTYDEELSALIMVTDGIWEVLKPYLLNRENNSFYVPIAFLLSDFNCYKGEINPGILLKNFIEAFLNAKIEPEHFYKRMRSGLNEYFNKEVVDNIIDTISAYDYPLAIMSNIVDDKTVVGIINSDYLPEHKDAEYYKEPDWKKLQDEWNKLAYPHLYAETHPDIAKYVYEQSGHEEEDAIPDKKGENNSAKMPLDKN